MRRNFISRIAFFVFWGVLLVSSSSTKSAKPLRIFFIDVEGGQSTLIVTPAKQSLLIDAGWSGERDAARIQAAASSAGIKQIDYLVITHYHSDHVGGVSQLAERLPIGSFIDHGPDIETSDAAKDLYGTYEKVISKSRHAVVKPGDGLPFKEIQVEFVAAAGAVLHDPLPGAGEANPYCSVEKEVPPAAGENTQSIGLLITYGKFRFLDLGDLTADKELQLACPNNLLGTVDLFLTTHHGLAPDNPKALVWAVHPVVAIMNNGAHKGGSPEAWQIIHDSPGLQSFWQLHYVEGTGKEPNAPDNFIGNINKESDGHFIEVIANPDGTFEVISSRNNYAQKYAKK